MPQAGYVYMIHGRGTAYIKIGQSTNVFKRLQKLQEGVPFPLQLISVQLVADMDEAEEALLAKYKRYQSRGEWFEMPPEILQQWPLDAPIAPIANDKSEKVLGIKKDRYSILRQQILEVLINRNGVVSAQSICAALEMTSRTGSNRVAQQLFRMAQAGLITKVGRAHYVMQQQAEIEGVQNL